MQEDKIIFILEQDFPAGTTAAEASKIVGQLAADGHRVQLLTARQVQSADSHWFSRRAGYVRDVLAAFDELLERGGQLPQREVVFKTSDKFGFFHEEDRRLWGRMTEAEQGDAVLAAFDRWRAAQQPEQENVVDAEPATDYEQLTAAVQAVIERAVAAEVARHAAAPAPVGQAAN